MARAGSPSTVATARLEGVVASLPIFKGLSEAGLQRILRVSYGTHLMEGTTVFREGDESDAFFVVIHGMVAISSKTAGHLHTMVPGDSFGELGTVTGRPRTATASATTDIDLVEISRSDYEEIRANDPAAANVVLTNIMAFLGDYLTGMNELLATEHVPQTSE